jgi:hypothetical protein
MERIKVAVSPFYGGEDWTDELTNITFQKSARGLNVYSIPAGLDLTNIRKAIRLNALMLVEGNVGDFNEVEEVVIEEPVVEEPKVEEPVQEVVVEEPVAEEPVLEIKEEEKKPAPKKKTTKKASK